MNANAPPNPNPPNAPPPPNPAHLNLDTLDVRRPLGLLVPNNNIQVDDIVRNIEPFIIWNLKTTFMRNIHYEHESYGAINDYLHAIFPPSRRFSVTPQSLLRVAVPAPDLSDAHSSQALGDEEVVDEAADTSLGFYGAYHRSRHHAGQEAGRKYIDFTASKVSVDSLSVPEHKLLTFVEVKREELSDNAIHAQMVEYMRVAWENPDKAPNFRSFVVSVNDHRFIEYEFGVVVNGVPAISRVHWFGDEILAPGTNTLNADALTEKLANISRRFWN